MRHRKSRLRLRHKPAYAKAMLRNMLTSVLLYESIRTTKKRAQVVRPQVEKLITIAKTKQPHIAIRAINGVVTDKNASRKLMEVLKQRYATRTSGYTRIIPVGARIGDGAMLVTLELVDGIAGGVEAPAVAPKTTKKKAIKKEASVSAQ